MPISCARIASAWMAPRCQRVQRTPKSIPITCWVRATEFPRPPSGLKRSPQCLRRPSPASLVNMPRIKPGRALPGLRHAAPCLWRTGGAGRLRAGCHHRQRGHTGWVGQRIGYPGSGWRPVLDAFPNRRESSQSQHPGLPVERGLPARARDDPADGVIGVPKPGDRHQADLRRGDQLPDQPACRCQPLGSNPAGRSQKWNSSWCRITSSPPPHKFADLVLPACTQFETWGVEDGWKYGDEVILQPKLVEPPGECKSDYRICADLAERLGLRRGLYRRARRKSLGGMVPGPFQGNTLPRPAQPGNIHRTEPGRLLKTGHPARNCLCRFPP